MPILIYRTLHLHAVLILKIIKNPPSLHTKCSHKLSLINSYMHLTSSLTFTLHKFVSIAIFICNLGSSFSRMPSSPFHSWQICAHSLRPNSNSPSSEKHSPTLEPLFFSMSVLSSHFLCCGGNYFAMIIFC